MLIVANDIPLIVLDPQQCGNFLRVGKPPGLHGGIRQIHGNESPNDYGQRSNSNVEDPPACKLCVGEADTVGDEAAKDLCKGVADIEPGNTTTLFALFIPHCDDQDEDGCDAEKCKQVPVGERQGMTLTSFQKHQAVSGRRIVQQRLCIRHDSPRSSPIS